MTIEIPTFKFALREDLKDDKRFLTTKGEPDATGYDVRAAQEDRKPIIVKAGEYVKVPLGFRAFCPRGWWYLLAPRSSMFFKKECIGFTGIIDEAYPNQAIAGFIYHPDGKSLSQDLVINFGDAIGQIIPQRREEVDMVEISNNEIDADFAVRGAVRTGGFGSTSK
jgi:dUTPase